jgi:hypothetical protein
MNGTTTGEAETQQHLHVLVSQETRDAIAAPGGTPEIGVGCSGPSGHRFHVCAL